MPHLSGSAAGRRGSGLGIAPGPAHILWSWALAASIACAGEPPPAGSSVRDSGGVSIVDHGPLSDAVAFGLGAPVFRAGRKEGEPQWVRVSSGALLPDGRVVIGEAGTNEVIILSEVGAVEAIWGGTGQGPNQVGQLASLWHVGGDTVLVEDDGNGRMAFFHDGVATERSYRIADPRAVYHSTGIGLDDAGGLVTATSGYRLGFSEPWLRGHVVRHDLVTGDLDTIRSYDLVRKRPPEGEPFAPHGHVAVTAGGLGYVRSDRAQLERMDPRGRTTYLVRWSEARRPVPEGAWAESEGRKGHGMAHALPYTADVHGDPWGNLWVGEYDGTDPRYTPRYRIFSADGAWLGWVEMPVGFQVLDIGGDRVLGVHRDELDVESVAVYPIER